ncbi:efflux RND transporter periplasmic adaptor subunit [Aeoliella sp. SH292]|uniref:efflux RND transporter periplasmic adaptor subunit n=1 Tax=Aeoliella sp. SH292 TaxID=3454464 RepID=UPI003F98BCF9
MNPIPATNDAPLLLTPRADVMATAVWVPGRAMWVLKDPMTLEHHELGEIEYLLLTELGGRTSLRKLQRALAARFAPRTFNIVEIQTYLGRLHQAGLVVARAVGQGEALGQRAEETRARRLRWSWAELLALRLPGFDPDRMLDHLLPLARVLFHPMSLVVAACVVLGALGLVVSHGEEFVDRLPALDVLMAPQNWLLLALVVAVVKVLHELGHAMVAKYLGAEVHEMGVLLLVFVPTLYCDVTDIWSLASKWRRMAVSAAGMGVELVLASLATFVWWFSEPGLVNLLALNTMIVASIGTVLVNANPLMRYDGYYLLADLCEVPNLWQRSRDAVRSRVARLFFRPPQREVAEPAWMAVYGGMSTIYMTLVLVAIFWMTLVALEPLGAGVIAYAIGGVMLAGVVARPAQQLTTTLKNPVRRGEFRPGMSLGVLLVAGLALAGLWRLPIPGHVECAAHVAPSHAVPIVTTMAGSLRTALPAGTMVEQGDVVAELASPELELAAARLAGEVRLAKQTVEKLETLRARDAESSRELPAARATLADAKRRVKELDAERERLVLRAPRSGELLPTERKPAERETVTLATWSGTPLEEVNRGAWLETGTPVAMVADRERREIALDIDERDIERVAPGQRVRVQLSATGSTPLEGTIREIARVGQSSERNSGRNDSKWLPSPADITTRYQALVDLDDCPAELPLDSGGRAKIDVGRTTVGEWITREVRETFRLP